MKDPGSLWSFSGSGDPDLDPLRSALGPLREPKGFQRDAFVFSGFEALNTGVVFGFPLPPLKPPIPPQKGQWSPFLISSCGCVHADPCAVCGVLFPLVGAALRGMPISRRSRNAEPCIQSGSVAREHLAELVYSPCRSFSRVGCFRKLGTPF